MSYKKFLKLALDIERDCELTNLVECADAVGINHNAAAAAAQLGLFEKQKSHFEPRGKWVSKFKKPTAELVEKLKRETRLLSR